MLVLLLVLGVLCSCKGVTELEGVRADEWREGQRGGVSTSIAEANGGRREAGREEEGQGGNEPAGNGPSARRARHTGSRSRCTSGSRSTTLRHAPTPSHQPPPKRAPRLGGRSSQSRLRNRLPKRLAAPGPLPTHTASASHGRGRRDGPGDWRMT